MLGIFGPSNSAAHEISNKLKGKIKLHSDKLKDENESHRQGRQQSDQGSLQEGDVSHRVIYRAVTFDAWSHTDAPNVWPPLVAQLRKAVCEELGDRYVQVLRLQRSAAFKATTYVVLAAAILWISSRCFAISGIELQHVDLLYKCTNYVGIGTALLSAAVATVTGSHSRSQEMLTQVRADAAADLTSENALKPVREEMSFLSATLKQGRDGRRALLQLFFQSRGAQRTTSCMRIAGSGMGTSPPSWFQPSFYLCLFLGWCCCTWPAWSSTRLLTLGRPSRQSRPHA